jgi:hypothetical protein
MRSRDFATMLACCAVAAAWGCASPTETLPDVTLDWSDPDMPVDTPVEVDPDAEADMPGDVEPEPVPDADMDALPDGDVPADPDADMDGPVDTVPDPDGVTGPFLSGLSPVAAAHGGYLTLTGSNLAGTTVIVSVGGEAQTVVSNTGAEIRVGPISDALAASTAVGDRSVVVTVDGETSNSVAATVIRLVINELDSDTPSTPTNDDKEFVEISAGLAGVSLYGYLLVRYNGSGDASYGVTELGDAAGTIVTGSTGLLLVGNTSLTPAPDIALSTNTLQNGADAVAIHQGSAADFPSGTPVTSVGLIDALVYDTADADDPELLSVLLGSGPHSVQVNENQNGSGDVESIFRCCDARLDGRSFHLDCPSLSTSPAVGVPTPGAPNAACP